MKRYRSKIARRYGIQLGTSPKSPTVRRNYPPGIHGPKGHKKKTEYGAQLAEKQKAKVIYNILTEKQFRLTFVKAAKTTGDVGQNLLLRLEQRLDNVIYRLSLATTRPQARQLVNHAHFLVNGKKVNIPSAILQPGDVITLRPHSAKAKYFQKRFAEIRKDAIPGWLYLDIEKREAKILHAPKPENVEQNISTQAIVEYYSRR
ncbi:30S ribosomal protein S4 [Candidatus Falkowbacteria bacterium RIFOXYC2_FULL_47_12]|uniref:Small ribosomal subunit protein uS4 n=2 Tax=Candidatus Falkowiibacteriota TaxID=1752728 RepID=A0A1F5TRC1_9BACT|nr:MAG: 30S ribosomal protein S4 [Candidatus Falkowbacteria bacterium RIFOXYA2_FULL_47_9]OGF41399.1 MAG: 30S ribosomal protein S4 [Candidatus Falkowbacteria bacterium RIFOXYC2_FULL_47_12]